MSNLNNFSAEDKASILVEALPYIQEFYGKTIVIKYGGNAMINDTLKEQVMKDIVLMKYVGIRPVIVHGGGPDITSFLKKFGKVTEFVSGLRVTDKETVQIAEMVLAGKINSEIVNRLNRLGIRAVGLSGKDSDLIIAHKKLAEVHNGTDAVEQVDIGYVGEVEKINTALINDLLDNDYVPVIAPIGAGHADESFNINADYVAAEVAGALQAEKLLLLTDTKGIYRDFEDKSSFSTISISNPAGANTCAAFLSSSIRVLIPRDIFADFKIATFSYAFSTSASCCSESPVVQSTIGICFSTPYASSASTAFALEKSMITSASTVHSFRLANIG